MGMLGYFFGRMGLAKVDMLGTGAYICEAWPTDCKWIFLLSHKYHEDGALEL